VCGWLAGGLWCMKSVHLSLNECDAALSNAAVHAPHLSWLSVGHLGSRRLVAAHAARAAGVGAALLRHVNQAGGVQAKLSLSQLHVNCAQQSSQAKG